MLRYCLESFNHLIHPLDAWFAVDASMPDPPPLFILGAPRSGTTLAYQVITQQFQISYFTAPLGYAYGLANWVTRLLRSHIGRPVPVFESHYGQVKGILAPSEHAGYWFQWFPRDGPLGHYVDPTHIQLADYTGLQRSLASLTAIAGKPWVFKNLYLGMVCGVLAQILPEARFIFVHRDPLLICQSVLLGRLRQPDKAAWWSVKPPNYWEWLSLPLWQQVTRQVFHTQWLIEKDLATYAANRTLFIDYNELCLTPSSMLTRLGSWLSIAGYKAYEDVRIPPVFPVSKKIRLEKATMLQIRDELNRLRMQYATSI